jgi:hypothetical protein
MGIWELLQNFGNKGTKQKKSLFPLSKREKLDRS